MSDIFITKVAQDTFVCQDAVSMEYAASVKLGDTRKVKITKPRNVKFHNKFWGMIDLVANNQERIEYSTAKQGRERLIYAVMYILRRGTFWGPQKEHFERDSISFANMDEIEFSQLYTETLDVCLKHFVPMDKDDFEMELLGFS